MPLGSGVNFKKSERFFARLPTIQQIPKTPHAALARRYHPHHGRRGPFLAKYGLEYSVPVNRGAALSQRLP
jgi:hypothetical protein